MNITKLPEGAIKDGIRTHIFYEWYKENEEAIYEVFEQTFYEWLEKYVDSIAEMKDISFEEKI